ncbi:CvpA family protein [Rhodoferax ferrireducens]|uniref:CvpA family protein n=1 Tax=Rhodoferax ferrireducens TaxID=192843 RepID=UPI000E0D8DA0|nr:CvpA family protein [Rhodoferax ferrireducens]
MPVLDWIFLAVLMASLALGAWRGLIYEVMSVVSWIAAFILAQWFAPDVAQKLPMSGSAEPVRYAAGFALVFVLSVFAGSLLAKLVQKLFAAVGLQPADRALGAAFGLVRGLVVVLAATVVISMSPLKSSEWWQESVGAGMTVAALKGLKPVLPDEFGRYLPS